MFLHDTKVIQHAKRALDHLMLDIALCGIRMSLAISPTTFYCAAGFSCATSCKYEAESVPLAFASGSMVG